MVSAIRADVFGVCFRYRQFCRSLELFACERSYQTKLRESDFKKEQTLPRGREGEVSGEGGFELGCNAALRETSSRPRATLFFSAGFFSLEKKRVHHAEPQTILSVSRAEFMCFRQPERELAKNNAKRIFIKEASREPPYGVEMKKAKSGGSQSGRVRKNPSFIYLSSSRGRKCLQNVYN